MTPASEFSAVELTDSSLRLVTRAGEVLMLSIPGPFCAGCLAF
jgi:hypothetical protein